MTRKDFELIAEAIRNARANEVQMGADKEHLIFIDIALSSVAQQLVNSISQNHPRFNADKFLDACEVIY